MPVPLYLVAYDIRERRRLQAVFRIVRAHGLGGQKSVHECRLRPAQLDELKRSLDSVIDKSADRLTIIRLDPRSRSTLIGTAQPPADPDFLYCG